MNEMFNYMFRTMKTSEAILEKTGKAFRRQGRFNRLIVVAGVFYVVWSEQKRLDQEDKIAELDRKVKELQEKEGA